MYCVYVLRSLKDDRFYIGQTKNLTERLKCHQRGKVNSTRNRRPLELIISKEYPTRSEAVKNEIYLKSLKGGNEFKKILKATCSGVAKR